MTTKQIAVVCALPGSPNTGMFTVDHAAFQFFREHFPDCETSFYALGDIGRHPFRSVLPFALQALPQCFPAVLGADAIVYWGDFLHARNYWPAIARRLVDAGLSENERSAYDIVYRMFMLEGAAPETLAKAILFGGTILTNTPNDLADARYAGALATLCAGAHAVLFRDHVSTAQVSGHGVGQGCDAALLPLGRQNAEELRTEELRTKELIDSMGVFFGRARTRETFHYHRLARNLARRLNAKARWISWLRISPRAQWLARVFGHRNTALAPSPQDALAQLERTRFVVTDTYHLALNAWRRGIPAVCIGRREDFSRDALTDRKKDVAYRMLGAEDFYVFADEIASVSGLRRQGARVAATLRNKAAIDAVIQAVNLRGATTQTRLIGALNTLIR